MYLWGGWLLQARISPHLSMMDLAVWQNGQLSDRDIQPTLCPHDGWAHANTQCDQRWNPAAPWPVEEGPKRVCSQKHNHATHIVFNRKRNVLKYRIMKGLYFSLCTIMHSNPDIQKLIHLKAEGRLSVPSRHQARLSVSQNVRLWEMATHHVSIYGDTLTDVFPTEQSVVLEVLTVPGEHKCASAYPHHQWDEERHWEGDTV